MNEKDREFIQEIVRMTVAELQRAGMLKDIKDTSYTEANDLLKRFYSRGEKDADVAAVLAELEHDPYFKIIPMYYGYGYTIDEIADAFDVETSTISRNKKRLCIEVIRRVK